MTDMEFKGSAIRIRNCASDLLSIGDDLMDHDESWGLISRNLQLKSMFLFCDFNKMISTAPKDQKNAFIELGNKLFSSIEELDNAVKIQNISLAHHRYDEAAIVLQEVLETLLPIKI